MAGVLGYCEKCGMTTAHVGDECQRCAFIKAHPKRPRKPMTDAAKERLREANERRKKEREARRRDAQTTNNGGN
jgi:hypothetical protein